MKKKILYLTDLSYEAKGRNYSEEDIFITEKLKDFFEVIISNPINSEKYENKVDLIVFRNTGGVSGFKSVYNAFVERVKENKLKTYNEFLGKADMCGKQYLLDLTEKKFPVIPTIDSVKNIELLPDVCKYVIKPKDGADSIGLEFLSKNELFDKEIADGEMLIQPAIDFEYEVSFYFIDDKLEYALYAPNKEKRWKLEKYNCSNEDIEFARKLIEWNEIKHGIQRVDACRTKEGQLLLVELEDLNPYLSILELDVNTRETFINDFINALRKVI